MANYYQLYIKSPDGTLLDIVSDFGPLTYSRRVNQKGTLSVSLPPRLWAKCNVPETIIEVWKTPDNAAPQLELETAWICKWFRRIGRDRYFDVKAYDLLSLLEPRVIAYLATTYQANKTGPIDNMCKAIVSENIGSFATTARQLANFNVEYNAGLAPSISKAFSYRAILKTLQELCDASSNLGTYLAFDIVPIVPTDQNGRIEFRTYVNQRGANRTYSAGYIKSRLSVDNNTILNPIVTYDYTAEINSAYVLGQGQDVNRQTYALSDTNRTTRSRFALRESAVDARNNASVSYLQTEAQAALQDGRPRKYFEAQLKQTSDFILGRDFGFGDILTAQYEDDNFDCRVDGIEVSVKPGQSDIVTAKLESTVFL